MVKNLPAMWETWLRFQGWEDPLDEGMATHSSILAWRTHMDRGAWQACPWGHKESDTIEWLSTTQCLQIERQTDALNLKQNSSSLPNLFPCFCLCLLWFRSLFKKSFLGCHHLIDWVTWSKERPNYLVKSKARIERKKHSDILVTVYIQVEFLLITGSQNKFLKNTRETCGRTFWTRKRQRPLSVYY